MRPLYFYLFFVLTFFFSSQVVFAVSASVPDDCRITSTLRVGFKGVEVQCLQRKIGVAADGSFGPLTKAAVSVFQSNNRLVADGIVGAITRGVLNSVKTNATYPAGCLSAVGYSPTTGVKCDGTANDVVNKASNPVPTSNPFANNTNLDQFIKTVVEVNRKNGKSEKELSVIADTLRKEVSNSNIDYSKKFKELLINESKLSLDLNEHPFLGFFDKAVSKALSFLGITPPVAQAATGIPFGGALIFPFFCAANSSWMITISPLPPTYVTLLSYYPGTQGFASYNIPFTNYLLGAYVVPGVCAIPGDPVIIIPTEGTITPMVGSSPL
ncbi:MAG: peptidoglycan-binding domain-containing protein [Candidatus Pacebacteria bacterium]|nr:peptidoglycan-binding domain-containing protein [Candidatus Paceibacterota bacterium]